jgi:hypothetical protein
MPRRKMIIPVLFKFEGIGDSVRGFLTIRESQFIQGKPAMRYVLKDNDQLHILNGTVQIDDALAAVETGEFVEIILTGIVTTQAGFNLRQFDVFVGVDEVSNVKK